MSSHAPLPIRKLFLRRLAGCAALAVLLTGRALADDTELFLSPQGGNADSGRTNVLFIIDTSGSMSTLEQTQAPWNPATAYSGCYHADAVYFGTTTTLPDCSSTNFIPKSANFCQASVSPLRTVGQYGGFLLAWNDSRRHWDPLTATDNGRPVECQADRGINGNGNASQTYAANGDGGPWAADATNEPAWNNQLQLVDGNWLNWKTNPPTTQRSRLQIVQDVVDAVVENLRNVNVGVMRFNVDNGGSVIQAMANVDTARAGIESAVNNLSTGGPTPLAETLYEATQYFLGGRVDFGNVSPVFSVAAARVGGTAGGTSYLSPVTSACQRNYIVLLTDGEPNQDSDADARIAALPDFTATLGHSGCDGSGDGHCLDDVAEYLFKHDLNPNLPGLQNVIVNTIGFTVDTQILADTARRGGGQYFLADDTASLSAVLTELVRGVVERAGSFTAPVLPANAFNRTESSGDAYVALFQPTGTAHWPGNLKKYLFLNGQLVGANGLPAVNAATGFFSSDAQSFWSAAPDGDRVPEGGAALQIPDPPSRNVYTDISGGTLTAAGNRVAVGNTALTAGILGVAPGARDNLVLWATGRDVNDDNQNGSTSDTRHAMGDPLHAKPVTVTYGGTDQSPVATIYVATNDGYLHAVDAATGRELWSFIPKRLLPRLQELYVNADSPVHRYGLDGELRVYIRNDDGVPGITGSEQAILVFGMGRGGDAVFALDVTNRAAPRELWQIDSTTPGFETLGQTWSTPVVTKVNVNGTVRLVAIFGGGYDDSQDNRGYHIDGIGNAVYIVDLLSGERLWSGGFLGQGHLQEFPEMRNSIPAPVRVVDLDGDGLADRFYVGDMGGRVWRFDIVNGLSGMKLAEGGVIATLGAADLQSPTPADVRRFYVQPDVTLTTAGRQTFLSVNLGSGFRGHPLDTDAQDEFFAIRDYAVGQVILSGQYPAPVTVDQLVDVTGDAIAVLPPDAKGWALRMVQGAGEKVLSASLTLEGTIFFSSFQPAASSDPCLPGGGINRLYEITLLAGQPITNLDGTGDPHVLTVTDRFRQLAETGIAPPPAFLFPPGPGGPQVCIGLACFPARPDDGSGTPGAGKVRPWYWLQNRGQ